jgi:AcrR family transcriptional regulator
MDMEKKLPEFFVRDITTKEKIFNAAVKLYSERGFAEVTMRHIAEEVGINAAAIYRYYPSKEALLHFLYEFYSAHWDSVAPELDELLALCETSSPQEVFNRIQFRFDPELEETMDHIVKIAVRQINVDPRSAQFIGEHAYQLSFWSKILKRMIELDKIEPIDVDAFSNIIANYNISTALLNRTPLETKWDTWQTAFRMIFTLLKVK